MNETIDLKQKNPFPLPATAASPAHTKEPALSWNAPEYRRVEHSREWFWSIGIIAGGVSIFSVILGNVLFALVIVLSIFLLFTYALQAPREYVFSISRHGVAIGNRLFEMPHLQSFWIFEHETGDNELSVMSKKTFLPYIKIPLGGTDPNAVREVLKHYIPEVIQDESLIDILARRFGL